MDVDDIQQDLRQEFPDLSFRTPPNWTAVLFIALLGALHIAVAVPAFLAGRWEGYLSAVFATILTAAAVVVYHLRWEVFVSSRLGVVRARICVGRIRLTDRRIPFAAVHGVRVTLGPRATRDDSFVELLCAGHGGGGHGGGDVACPPSDVPREQGLLLAMMLDVPLVKAWEDGVRAPAIQPQREEHPETASRRSASTPG
jgi:hypothetical protein